MQGIYERARNIRVAVFDVDGVMTDGSLYYADSGEELKAFNVRDGHGMKMLKDSGVALAIITSRTAGCVEARARNLGIDHLFQGATDKTAAFQALRDRLALSGAACAYLGDDLVDLPVMAQCGLAAAVPDAAAAVRHQAHYVTRARGGHGAVREFCDVILYAQVLAPAQRSRTAST